LEIVGDAEFVPRTLLPHSSPTTPRLCACGTMMTIGFVLTLLVLRFDGSFRPPRDPGFPTKSLQKLATCGAAVLDGEGNIIALGGVEVPFTPDTTSQHVEFDSLLMGLSWLCNQSLDWWEVNGSSPSSSLVITGDCKPIIQQFQDRSLPRKLKPQHETASALLEKLEQRVSDISFEHIPREENALCDSICGSIVELHAAKFRNDLWREVGELRSVYPCKLDKKSLSSPLSKCAKKYLGEGSLIPISSRIPIYRDLFSIGREVEDGLILYTAGQLLESEAKAYPSHLKDGPGITKELPTKELLTAVSVWTQTEGLQMLGRKKDSDKLLRKHRYILSKFDNNNLDHLTANQRTERAPSCLLSEQASKTLASWQQKAKEDLENNPYSPWTGLWVSV